MESITSLNMQMAAIFLVVANSREKVRCSWVERSRPTFTHEQGFNFTDELKNAHQKQELKVPKKVKNCAIILFPNRF